MASKKLYDIWRQMLMRCYRKENSNYKYYGERGISVCEQWRCDSHCFEKWALDNGYREGLSIDRINPNGNYEPSNCRWVTIAEQASNTRKNVFYTIGNETHTLSEWARIIHRSKSAVCEGIKRKGLAYLEKRIKRKEERQ